MALLKNMLRLGGVTRDFVCANNRLGIGQVYNLSRQFQNYPVMRKEEPLEAVTIVRSNRDYKIDPKDKMRDKEALQEELDVIDIDALLETDDFKIFPDETTPDTLYNGIKFSELPYVNIRMHKNNTKLYARTWDQKKIFDNKPAQHGFLNAKKRTAVAGQVAGSMMGQKLRGYGHKYIRVRLNGFNLARESTVKGLTQAGIVIVAIQDATRCEWNWPQRGKARPSSWKPPRI